MGKSELKKGFFIGLCEGNSSSYMQELRNTNTLWGYTRVQTQLSDWAATSSTHDMDNSSVACSSEGPTRTNIKEIKFSFKTSPKNQVGNLCWAAYNNPVGDLSVIASEAGYAEAFKVESKEDYYVKWECAFKPGFIVIGVGLLFTLEAAPGWFNTLDWAPDVAKKECTCPVPKADPEVVPEVKVQPTKKQSKSAFTAMFNK